MEKGSIGCAAFFHEGFMYPATKNSNVYNDSK